MMQDLRGLIKKTKEDLSKLTGLEPSSTIKTVREGSEWVIDVEMVEKHSIPDGMDILATYEVRVDEEGEVAGFTRKGMRKRMETAGE
jgi:hypothetical protein